MARGPGGSELLREAAGSAPRRRVEDDEDGAQATATRAAFARVAADVVGAGAPYESVYGRRRLLYADWAASGRALHAFETLLLRDALPLYANAHTSTSLAGLQASAFRDEARAHVAAAFNARIAGAAEHGDVVLWTGSGATGAVDRLVRVLGLERAGAFAPGGNSPPAARGAEGERAVVLVGPWEHHSNLLPWRESAATVVQLGEDEHGRLDRAALRAALVSHASAPLLIGAFSGCSNVTGGCDDDATITQLLHAHGALAVWDYAAGAPHGRLDMNPAGASADGTPSGWAGKDAVVLSPHKLPGGVGAPGVLIVKQSLLDGSHPAMRARRAALEQRPPSVVGGGAVSYTHLTLPTTPYV